MKLAWAARGNRDGLHQYGNRLRSDSGHEGCHPGDDRFRCVQRKLTKHQAYQLVSLAGNVAITQLVDKPNTACMFAC